jgi:hypothetical protein
MLGLPDDRTMTMSTWRHTGTAVMQWSQKVNKMPGMGDPQTAVPQLLN